MGFYGFIISANQLRKGYNYLFYWFTTVAWLLATIGFALVAASLLLLLIDLAKTGSFFVLLSVFFALLTADTLKEEQIEPIKLTLFLIAGVILFITTNLVPNSVFFAPDIFGSEGLSGLLYVIIFKVIAGEIVWVYLCYCAYLAHKRAPIALKLYSRGFLIGILFVNIAIFSQLLQFMEFYFILSAIGVSMMAHNYSHEPKLLFVLPFTALRLAVLDTKGGLPLFTHTWNRVSPSTDDILFSGMLQGITIILKESLDRGDVQEIRMSNALMIIYRIPKSPIAFIFAATRASRTLRDGLKLFAEQFCNEFQEYFIDPTHTDRFQ